MLPELGPEGEFERKRLARLVKLQHIDTGFFLLASHSYIESWLRQYLHMWEDEYGFDDLIFRFKINIIENKKAFPRELSVLQVLRAKKKTASAVQHHFVEISTEEAAAAAYRLIQFCRLAGITADEELEQISSSLEIWEDRSLIPDDELSRLRRTIAAAKKQNQNLLAEIEKLRKYRTEAEHYARRAAELEREIARLKNENFGGQAAELVRQMAEAEKNRDETKALITELGTADEYISNLNRLSSYTRTRLDFERDVTRLTEEQQTILDSINLTDDFLVKGGAGTGKTLVLIKALEKAIRAEENELSFNDEGINLCMLTYNRTLAKYDRYLAEILKQEKDAANISTVDKFLYDRLKMINEDYRIIFDDSYAEEIAAELNTTSFLSNKELADEIEHTVFGNAGEQSASIKLNRKQRAEVLGIAEKAAELMRKASSFTKNYSRRVILEYLEANPDENKLRDTDFTFIDEVQDLTPADIRAVKACTRRAVVMAGDSDQSIYRSGFSFSKAGVDIRGTTKILKTNFRNTCEIQALSEKYRLLSDKAADDIAAEAFRTGPPPELYCGSNRELDGNELITMICSKVKIFIEELSYDPENICILVPGSKDIEDLRKALEKAGYESQDLREDNFSFSSPGIIRISTMHSSKGLDFPVVLLYLNKLPQTSASLSDTAIEKIRRNLIYVSMTRAMDHLNIFISEDEKSPEITDLAGVFQDLKQA